MKTHFQIHTTQKLYLPFSFINKTKAMAFNGGYKIMTTNALSSISIFPSEYYSGFPPSLTTPCADIQGVPEKNARLSLKAYNSSLEWK